MVPFVARAWQGSAFASDNSNTGSSFKSLPNCPSSGFVFESGFVAFGRRFPSRPREQ